MIIQKETFADLKFRSWNLALSPWRIKEGGGISFAFFFGVDHVRPLVVYGSIMTPVTHVHVLSHLQGMSYRGLRKATEFLRAGL
jgi:hypothetical protein